jgi:hypothetical protein
MRARSIVLATVLFLAAAALATAATPDLAVGAAAAAPALCAAPQPQPLLPASSPPLFFAVSACGSCSVSACVGHTVGSPCVTGSTIGNCFANALCPNGGFMCLCLALKPK